MTERNELVDFLKGYACVMVLVYHVLLGIRLSGMGEVPPAFAFIENITSTFHVPLFLFLSGYVYSHNGRWTKKGSKGKFLLNKLLNIGIPYLIFSTVYILVNTLIPGTNHDCSLTDVLFLWKIPVAHYWFLYDLLMLFILFVLLGFVSSRIITIALFVIYLANSYIFKLDIPFFGGALAASLLFGAGASLRECGIDIEKKIKPAAGALLCAVHLALSIVIIRKGWAKTAGLYQLNGLLGIAASVFIGQMITRIDAIRKAGLYICRYSFQIYLLHIFFTAGIRIILMKCGITLYYVQIIAGTVSGLVFPMLIGRLSEGVPLLGMLFYPSRVSRTLRRGKKG